MVGVQKTLDTLSYKESKIIKRRTLPRALSGDFHLLAKISHSFMLVQRIFFFE